LTAILASLKRDELLLSSSSVVDPQSRESGFSIFLLAKAALG
jgi:hypothetical protein